MKRRFRRTLPEQGARVRFLPALPRADFLSLLAVSDVVLDPLHFGGGNSSLEAIAVGAPVVTICGNYLRSRINSAIYTQIGYVELVAKDPAHYAALAVRLGTDPDYRAAVVQRLKAASNNLFDDHNASGELEQCLLALS